jgi:glycogen synthase
VRRPHIVLASQEVWPLVLGGGIGRHVSELARLLSESADVTVLTSARSRAEYERLSAEGHPQLAAGARYRWIEEPPEGDPAPFQSYFHRWSFCCWQAVRELANEAPIDLIEFEDYRGTGAVTINAKRAGAAELAATTVAVRLHMSWEMAAALDQQPRDSVFARSVMALERVSLRFADRLLHAAAPVLDVYRRFYGSAALAPAELLPPAFILPDGPGPIRAGRSDRRGLRLLCVGRLQRFKGTVELVQAMRSISDETMCLTLVGGDTATAPTGGSMRAYLERLAEGDPRIRFHGRAGREEVEALIDEHDVVVVPSRFESFNYVVREALARNRPVLATPVGGIVAGFVEGRSGWLTRDSSAAAIAEALRDLVRRQDEIGALIAAGEPRATVEEAIDPDALITSYHALGDAARAPGNRRPSRSDPWQASALVLATAGDGRLGVTLDALDRQTGVELEIVVATDDPLRVPPGLLERIHALAVAPSGAGRLALLRAGAAAMLGRGPVVLVSAGDAPEPSFASTGIAALESGAAAAYVTAHGDGLDPANAPLGNSVADLLAESNVSGAVAVARRETLEDVPPADTERCEDQAFFAGLAVRDAFGAVLPEPLAGRTRSRCRDAGAAARAAAAIAAGHELWTER